MKKFISTLAAVSILSSALSFVSVNAEDEPTINQDGAGVIVLEDHTASRKSHFTEASGRGYYGGSLVYVNENSSGDIPTLTWNFNVTNASGRFDMWIVTYNETGQNWISKYNYSLNGASATRGGSGTKSNRYNYPLPDGFYNTGVMAYMKAASALTLQSGANTLTYTLDMRVDPADNRYINAFDRIVLVPTTYSWEPKQEDYITSGSTEYLIDDVPGTPFQPDANDIIWMEAEIAASPDYSVVENESASGGKYLYMGKQMSDNTARFTTEFVFDIINVDAYDVWVLGVNRPDLTWYSPYETSLDGESYRQYRTGHVYGGYNLQNFQSLYSFSTPGGNLGGVKWTRANTSEKLSVGRHTFDVGIGVRPDGGRWYISQIDAVVIVPSRLNWVPDSINTPTQAPNRYAWIESENSIQESRFRKVINERNNVNDYCQNASNGTFIKYDADDPNFSLVKGNERLDYKFTLANAGNYDIYFLGILIDNSELSNLYYDIDNPASTIVDAGNTHMATASEVANVYSRSDSSIRGTEYWQKIGSGVSLSAGDHVLNTEWTEREAPTQNHYLSMDAYAIIPTAWNWSMPTTSEIAVYSAFEFDSTEQADVLSERYAAGVTRDIEGLGAYGSAGSHFTYDAKNPEYITNSGDVTRPLIYDGAQNAALEIFAHRVNYNATATDTATVNLSVIPEVVHTNFNAQYSNGTGIIKGALVSGATVSANAQVKKVDTGAKNALLVIAIFKNNRFQSAESSNITLTDSYQSLSASIELPSAIDMSIYEVRVFLWDNLENGIPYAAPLIY